MEERIIAAIKEMDENSQVLNDKHLFNVFEAGFNQAFIDFHGCAEPLEFEINLKLDNAVEKCSIFKNQSDKPLFKCGYWAGIADCLPEPK